MVFIINWVFNNELLECFGHFIKSQYFPGPSLHEFVYSQERGGSATRRLVVMVSSNYYILVVDLRDDPGVDTQESTREDDGSPYVDIPGGMNFRLR
jgi:hypothetical protein